MDQLAPHAVAIDGRTWRHRTLGLGLFSLGLGFAELLAPRVVARWIGVNKSPTAESVLRGLGIREIANGICLFARPSSPVWLWSRVVGDLMDLALLGEEFRLPRNQHARIAAAAAAVLGVTAMDALSAIQFSSGRAAPSPEPD